MHNIIKQYVVKRDWTMCLELSVILNSIVNVIGGEHSFYVTLEIFYNS